MNEPTFFDAWKGYEQRVIPPDAGPTQREECRRAFYAGAAACFSLMVDIPDGESDEVTEGRFIALAAEIQSITSDLRKT